MSGLLAAVLGGAAGLDRTAFGQTLLSHPAVIAAISGWLLGAPREGIWLGIALTLLAAPYLPVGQERLRDWPSAAVAVIAAESGRHEPWAWGLGLLGALLIAWAGGACIAAARRISGWRVGAALAALEQGQPLKRAGLERLQLELGAMELLRGGLTSLLGMLALRALFAAVEPFISTSARAVLATGWMVAPLLGLPLALRIRGVPAGARWAWPSLVGGVLLAWMLGAHP